MCPLDFRLIGRRRKRPSDWRQNGPGRDGCRRQKRPLPTAVRRCSGRRPSQGECGRVEGWMVWGDGGGLECRLWSWPRVTARCWSYRGLRKDSYLAPSSPLFHCFSSVLCNEVVCDADVVVLSSQIRDRDSLMFSDPASAVSNGGSGWLVVYYASCNICNYIGTPTVRHLNGI